MDFDTLDKRMREFEQSLDRTMPRGCFLVSRLDGHGFTRLTKKEWNLEKPFDIRFRDIMIGTLKRLMNCGFRMVYGYTQSDEISLLFHKDDTAFSRKERKLLSLLAAEASATFTSMAERPAVFDNRLIPLPNEESVVDYFRWRQEDAHRNSLNAHCYWLLRKQGLQAVEAQKRISGLLNVEKLNLLLSAGIEYEKIPAWQKYGVGMYFQDVKKNGYNPITKETVLCSRRTLFLNEGLPVGNEYSTFIRELLKHNTNANEQKCFNKI